MSFADLKRKSKSSIDSIREQLEKKIQPKTFDDDRFWTLQRTKDGNGAAIIRFLPQSDEDLKRDLATPWVEWLEFNFKADNGVWYIEKSLRTLNQPDPMYEYNGELWASGNKVKAQKQRQTKKYVANILVVKDPVCPENEGKVFLFKFGPQIYKMISDKAYPRQNTGNTNELDKLLGEEAEVSEQSDEKIDVTDIYTGENLKIKIYQKDDGFYTYDKSSWAGPSPLADSDKKIEEIWKHCYCLTDLIAPDKFKTYEELLERVRKVRGIKSEMSSMKTVDSPSQRTKPSTLENDFPFDDSEVDEALSDDNIAEFFNASSEDDNIPF